MSRPYGDGYDLRAGRRAPVYLSPTTRLVSDFPWNKSDVPQKKSESPKTSPAVIAALVSIVIAVTLVAVGIAVTVAVLRDNTSAAQETTDTYSVSFSIDKTFDPALNDKTSLEFQLLAEETCNQIKEVYRLSTLKDSYIGCMINGFSDGSIKADSTLLFDNRVDITTKQTPAGSSLTPEEYTVLEVLQNGGTTNIPDFLPDSIVVESVDTAANVTDLITAITMIERNVNCESQPCMNGGTCTDLLDRFDCACPPAYNGTTCSNDVPECTSTTCSGNGQCIEIVGGGTTCICNPGYTSANCQTNIDDCSDSPCSYGNCTDLVGNFSCTCEPGYTGYRCDVDTTECTSSTCSGNGECLELIGAGVRCICDTGYTSANCQTNLTECTSSTCSGNGECLGVVGAGVRCICDTGYTSASCQTNINDCSDNPCCYGNCTDLVGNFSCTCEPGYTGYRCDVDIIECGLSTCSGYGECIELDGEGTRCICYEGYTSANCSQNIDDCSDSPCSYGNCTDLVGNFSCTCEPGYTGYRCDVDIIECGSTTCSGYGECIELDGEGTRCICSEGYTSANCSQNIDDCSDSPCSYGNCTDLVGNFSCTCEPGYTGYRCDVDIIECGPTTCSGNGECIELDGEGTRCICYEGYTSANCSQNIDDCSASPCGYGNCTDLIGNFSCTCEPGYTGYKCDVDIIECGLSTCSGYGECIELDGEGTRCICYEGYTSANCSQNIDDCSASPCGYGNCTDLVGNFSCTCEPGYTGYRCDVDIIECGLSTCSGNGECIELGGEGTRCICYEGYTSTNCSQNIDDCSDSPCSYGNCTDLVGNFSCTCEPGYTGYRCDVDIIECGLSTCSGNGECIELDGEGTRCICSEGYTSANCSQNIDDCSDSPCSYGNCTDLVGNFSCTCEPGYTGYRCDVDIIECGLSTCSGYGDCIELDGEGTRCICYEGYTSANCSQNINDCSDSPCSYGNCTDLIGNFSCTCEPGYTGYRCDVDIVECNMHTCSGNGECAELVGGGIVCFCDDGWTSPNCSVDMNECLLADLNSCHDNANCTNTDGGYNCTCDVGFFGDGVSCTDPTSCPACDSTCDVRGLDSGVAQGRTVTSSSEAMGYEVTNLVDGNQTTAFRNVPENDPWFMIDLGAIYCVDSVMVVRESEPGVEQSISITVGDTTADVGNFIINSCRLRIATPALNETYDCGAEISGRFVHFEILGNSMAMAMLEVYVNTWTV